MRHSSSPGGNHAIVGTDSMEGYDCCIRDGSGDYRTLTEAMEGIRAFMDYKVTVLVKNGTYKEKVVIPSWFAECGIHW